MPRKEGGELMPDSLNPNKNLRRKGLSKGRPNIVEDIEDENNEDKEIYDKSIDRMSKGDMVKKPQKAFMGLAVQAAKKSPMSLIGVGANVFKRSQTARDIGSQLGLAPKALSDYYQKKEDDKQKSTGQVVAKAYTGKFIDVELDGQKYSNASKKNYYKGML